MRDRIAMFGLHDHRRLVVGALHVLTHAQPIPVRAGDPETALTRRRIFRRLDQPLRVLDGVDLRRDDAGGADVECALHVHLVAR